MRSTAGQLFDTCPTHLSKVSADGQTLSWERRENRPRHQLAAEGPRSCEQIRAGSIWSTSSRADVGGSMPAFEPTAKRTREPRASMPSAASYGIQINGIDPCGTAHHTPSGARSANIEDDQIQIALTNGTARRPDNTSSWLRFAVTRGFPYQNSHPGIALVASADTAGAASGTSRRSFNRSSTPCLSECHVFVSSPRHRRCSSISNS